MAQVVVVGSFNVDHRWATPALPRGGETLTGEYSTGPGGKGFNQALAARRAGADTAFVCALGDDEGGRLARSLAAENGVDLHDQRGGRPTGTAGIYVDREGRNCVVVGPGANAELSDAFVGTRRELIASARVALAQLESPPGAVLSALRVAREAGIVTIVNPAPADAVVPDELLAAAAILTPNETEFAALAARRLGEHVDAAALASLDSARLHALCRKLLPTGTVVVTLGERGCFVSHAESALGGDGAPHYLVTAAPAQALDTTGAGDAFNGALAASLAQAPGLAFAAHVRFATRYAALSTERAGAALSMPSLAEVQGRFGDPHSPLRRLPKARPGVGRRVFVQLRMPARRRTLGPSAFDTPATTASFRPGGPVRYGGERAPPSRAPLALTRGVACEHDYTHDRSRGGSPVSPAAAVASFGRRAGWLVALASLTGATNAVSALHQFAARPGDDESLASALSTLFGALVTLAGMAFFCATMVAFLLWLHRAVACALALSPPPHVLDFTPGQAVLTYFIPIVGLFRPYSHMSRLLIAIDPLALPEPAPPPEPVGDYRSPGTRPAPEVRWPESAPVGLWWASWLALSVVGQISFRTDDETSAFSALFNAFIAVSSSLLVVVVRSVSLRLRELARRGSVPLPPKPFYG